MIETMKFEHDTLGQRVIFGAGRGAENVAAEVDRLGSIRPMLIAGVEERALAQRLTGGMRIARTFDEVVQHVPIDVARRGTAAALESEADLLISIGGGSTTGLAKAIARSTGLPILAVPTTYAGSEATNVWGLTEAQRKTTGVDPAVLPVSVIYDATLTLTLPLPLSVASGLNALAHCVDSLWAPNADPINRVMAVEGARALDVALRGIVVDPTDVPSREQAQYAAYLAAVSFASAGSGIHHKICHVLGGAFDLPHAPTHAVVLPYVLAFNAEAAAVPLARLAAAWGATDAQTGLHQLLQAVGAPRSLRELGMPESGIAEAVDVALPLIPASNPRLVDRASLEALMRAAWEGNDHHA